MRKLIVSMNLTLDGFMADAGGGLDWHLGFWNQEMSDMACRLLSAADTLLLGRTTYEAMAGYWSLQAGGLARQDLVYAHLINNCRKIVFSRTLRHVHWRNAVLSSSLVAAKVRMLKASRGRDILVYGSGSVVSALMRAGVVDEYQLWVHPVLLGKGMPFLRDQRAARKMTLRRKMEFHSGVVLFFYRDAGAG